MPVVCRHCLVDGRVQGVFYRASTMGKANELGICGWARNLEDGRVEIMMQGTADQLDVFQDWLWEGSTASQVTSVQCQDVPTEDFDGFGVRH